MQTQEKFDLWCVVELMGHNKIAGRCTEQAIAGTNWLRVDVPETETQPPFTRLLGSAAIYAINPVDEQTCLAYVQKIKAQPIVVWEIKSYMDKLQLATQQLPSHQEKINTGNDDDLDEDLPY